jgi:Protein of unknown function (DUF1553)/Protein of unknown function (DUF1549)/Planctomycete cytochrome C
MPRIVLTSLLLALFLSAPLRAEENPHGDIFKNRPVPAVVDFNRDVRPVISEKCYHCHGADDKARKAKLRLDIRAEAVKDRDGKVPIKPGDVEHSDIVDRITTTEADDIMPPKKDGAQPLTAREIEIIKKWIKQGAPYAEHWAFIKPVAVKPSQIQEGKIQDTRNETKPGADPLLHLGSSSLASSSSIDGFINAKLAENGMKMSPLADMHTLVRRVALDLTGLPPTPEDMARFTDSSFIAQPSSFEKVVDHYLASPAYGESWARVWLDIARYADSAGYGSDPLRLNIWPYRDWLIKAFNKNMPYDQFTAEQLAGDLLPNPTEEQLVATAFHRNTMTNTEGGTDDEEFRVAAVKDRIAVTMQAWMGLTMGCAQCHSHKFDPISQKEYYQFYSIFNQTEDSDKADESPTMPLPTEEQRLQKAKLADQITALEKSLAAPDSPELSRELAEFEKQIQRPVAWTPLKPASAKGGSLVTLEVMGDNSILARGMDPKTDTYTVVADAGTKPVSAIRLELLTDKDLPNNGPGRSADGNAVLSEFSATISSGQTPSLKGRFVRLELPGKGRMLQLAEVQVFSAGENIAIKGTVKQSGMYADAEAKRAIDGNTEGDYHKGSVAHTAASDNAFWEVDLGAEKDLSEVVIWNRTDGGTGTRLDGVKLSVLDAARKSRFDKVIAKAPAKDMKVTLTQARQIKFTRISADYEQGGFEAAKAADGAKETGWAFGGETGKEHAIVFATDKPFTPQPGEKLIFTLVQNFGEKHNLGRFRLSVTDAPAPVIETPKRLKATLAKSTGERSPQEQAHVMAWFKPQSKQFAGINADLAKAKAALAAVKPLAVPVMKELAAEKRRETHFLNKGNFLDPGEKVEPALLASFNPAPSEPLTRLSVAKWLTSRDNPLTARVLVNRLWAQVFGTGIVETEEDFGTQGALPSHPELLDALAIELMDNGWNIKALLKTIVMSQTYQQSSKVTPEALQKDSRDRLLSHYPRRRLDAEQVRDQALALSGLLSTKIGGPSVYPPQPDGLWRAAFNGQRSWETSKGEDRYRRGLYTFWRRTVPYPSMATFDAPSRENTTLRRVPTNTPLQAFVTLNDPAYVEMAQALGRRIVKDGGSDVASRVRFGLELCLAKPATQDQITSLVQLYQQELENYTKDAEAAKKLAGAADNSAEMAAWTLVANVLLNLDGVLMKG